MIYLFQGGGDTMYPIEAVMNAMQYIDSHYQEILNSEIIAQTVSYSESHFRRIFSYVTGMSITDYIRDRRLSAAASYMTETENTILDIALSFGFMNQQTFDRAFKKKYGMTPKDFRSLHPSIEIVTPSERISRFYYRLMQGGKKMLQPYIVEKGVQKFVGRSVKIGGSKSTGEDIGLLYDNMQDIFSKISRPMNDRFYGITINFVNSTNNSRKDYWLCKEVETLWKDNISCEFEALGDNMETLILPATRWLYIPVRYDDPFIKSLAPEEFRDDPGYLTPCVYDWGRSWLVENGYKPQDYPFEMEIYGLHDGYDGIDGGANITLAIPLI